VGALLQWPRSLACARCGSACSYFTTWNGSFSDGPESLQYSPGARCEWMIAPTNAQQITIQFTTFMTEHLQDFVKLYYCHETACVFKSSPLVLSGEYSRLSSITSPTGYLLVEFTSDSGIQALGFTAAWSSLSTNSSSYDVSLLQCLNSFFSFYSMWTDILTNS
jgi:hypothetical protein